MVAATPPFTPADLDDMSKRLSIVELKKMVAEHAEHESAGQKGKSASSAGVEVPSRAKKRGTGDVVSLGQEPLAETIEPRPTKRATTGPPIPSPTGPSVSTVTVGAIEPDCDPLDQSFLG